MASLGLALSGGGFRATLYHLGVLRYLRDNGSLPLVTDIAAVSGGSVLAAHLVLNWERYTGSDEQFAEAAAEIIAVTQFDVRNRIVRRLPLLYPLRLAAKLSGWKSPGLSPNALLEGYYRRFLYGDRRLFELPEQPLLHILSTNVSDGVLAVFNRDGLHIQKRGVRDADPFRHIAGQTASVAKVVAASSAFPGFFPPVELTAQDLGVHEGEFPNESFTDGGVYDNLGTRAFAWLKDQRGKTYSRILVSDAGKPFKVLGNAPLGFVAQSIRASDILWDRVWQLERENFGDRNGFHFAPITRIVDPHEDPHALHPVVQAEISSIRTDLDRFSDLEVNALVQHGYEVTRSLHRQIVGETIVPVHEGPLWEPLPGRYSLAQAHAGSPAVAPTAGTARTAATSPSAALAHQLRRSSQRHVWSTLLDARDWPSYIFAALAALLLIYLPLHFYRLHRHAAMLTSVINSIAKGDPDIRLVLDLVENDPLTNWRPIAITDTTTPTPIDYTGVEILSCSRIIDLRSRKGGMHANGSPQHVHLRDRLVIRFPEGSAAGRRLVFRTLQPMEDVSYSQPKSPFPIEVRRVNERSATGEPVQFFELHCDLTHAPINELITLEMATVLRYSSLPPDRLPLKIDFPADLLTVWMLFPEDHPYRTYQLLRYPFDNPAASEPLVSRYTIDHPYGQLIGWSVLEPREKTVYECRWTSQ